MINYNIKGQTEVKSPECKGPVIIYGGGGGGGGGGGTEEKLLF